MRTLTIVCLFALLTPFWTGCASTTRAMGLCAATTQHVRLPDQTKPNEDDSKARIYVVRPYNYVGCAVTFRILENRNYIGEIGSGGYLCWETNPGKATLTLDATSAIGGNTWNTDLILRTGTVYYLQAKMGFTDLTLKVLDPEEGKRLLKMCLPPEKK